MTNVAPGWYDDPTEPDRWQRYWDGNAWTDRVDQKLAASLVSPVAPSVAQAPQPSAPASPARTQSTPSGPGMAVRSIGLLGNIIWVVLSGFWLFLGYLVAAFLNAITIIGIPFALQALKLAMYSLWPFGKRVVKRPGRSVVAGTIGNVIWFVLGGVWLALLHLITGALLCLTVIGLPLGLANLKLARLALWPMGRMVVPARDAHRFA